MTTEIEEVLDGLVRYSNPALRELTGRTDTCVAATRMAIEVLRYFGFEAEPMPVSTVCLNPPAAELLLSGRLEMDELLPGLPQWAVEEGAYWAGIGIGCSTILDDGVWLPGVGHVVCRSGERLIDPTLDQASLPEQNLSLAPHWSEVDWESGATCFETAAGALVFYQWGPEWEKDPFRQSPDWIHFKKRYGTLTGRVIREIQRSCQDEARTLIY